MMFDCRRSMYLRLILFYNRNRFKLFFFSIYRWSFRNGQRCILVHCVLRILSNCQWHLYFLIITFFVDYTTSNTLTSRDRPLTLEGLFVKIQSQVYLITKTLKL